MSAHLERLLNGEGLAAVGGFLTVTTVFWLSPSPASAASITIDLPSTPEDLVIVGLLAVMVAAVLHLWLYLASRQAGQGHWFDEAAAEPAEMLEFAGWRRPPTAFTAGTGPLLALRSPEEI